MPTDPIQPADPRLSPFDELEELDLRVQLAELDEDATMNDPDEHPKKPHTREEAVTNLDGTRIVDVLDPLGNQSDRVGFDDLSESDLLDADL